MAASPGPVQGYCLSAPVPAPAGGSLQGQPGASGDTKGQRKLSWFSWGRVNFLLSSWYRALGSV